jgi:hypothetical protein
VGKWLSQDPSGLGPDTNTYRYVGNSPVTRIDPLGLVPRCPAVGTDKSTGIPYDDTKLPEKDPDRAVPVYVDGKQVGWTYPNQKDGDYTLYGYMDDNTFYWRHKNGTFVHRCAYEDGENKFDIRQDGTYWGSSEDKARTKNVITYQYDPTTNKLRIRVYSKWLDQGGKLLQEETITGPNRRADLPRPAQVPKVP